MIETHKLYFPRCLYEDLLWLISTSISARKITHINEALYVYRQNRISSIIYTIIRSTQYFQFLSLYRSYTYCIQWLAYHDYLKVYSHSFYLLLESILYSFIKGKPLDEQHTLVSYIQNYLPYPIYIKIKKKIDRKRKRLFVQKILSVKNEYELHKQKVFYILGIKIPISRKKKHPFITNSDSNI